MVKWVVQLDVFGELIRTANSKERHMHLQMSWTPMVTPVTSSIQQISRHWPLRKRAFAN